MNQTKINNWITYSLIGASIIFFGLRLRGLIRRHSVNILFYDQWDFLTPLFGNPTAWEMFTRQHGPHRQGLGLFFSQAVGVATNWDTRAESIFIGFILLLATLCALLLKKRLFGKLTVWDAVIPSITLSFTQLEAVVLTPNPAHGALPLLLVLLGGLVLTLENKYLRYFGFVLIAFLATYTGFGVFLGAAAPAILFFSFLIHWANKERQPMIISGAALLASVASLASFFIDYTFTPVEDCFELPYEHALDYLFFVSLELSSFFGFYSLNNETAAKILGFLAFVALTGVLFIQIWQLWRKRTFESRHLVIFLLIAFSLLFAVNSTSGRICNGMAGAQSSRYMTLLIPGFLGLYFAAQSLSGKYQGTAANLVLIFLFIILPKHGLRDFDKGMYSFAEVKRTWAACYRERENIEECNRVAGNVIYPAPEATNLKEKLELLKEKKYNLYADK